MSASERKGWIYFKRHQDQVVRLQVAQRQGEEVLALGFHQRHAPALGLLLRRQFYRFGPLADLGPDDPAVDVRFAGKDRRIGRQRKQVFTVQGFAVLLAEDLGHPDLNQAAADRELALDSLEREDHARGFAD